MAKKPVTIEEKRWWIKQRIANAKHCDIFTPRDIIVAKAIRKDINLVNKGVVECLE